MDGAYPVDGYIRYYVPLDIDGITEAGLNLSGGAYARLPERHVTLELSIQGHGGIRRIRLVRIDWRSLKGGHSNDRRCAGPWAGKRVPETHFHRFDLNWIESERRMRKGKLPCAEPIDELIPTFEDLISFAGIHLNIKNINIVPRPNWEYDLFP